MIIQEVVLHKGVCLRGGLECVLMFLVDHEHLFPAVLQLVVSPLLPPEALLSGHLATPNRYGASKRGGFTFRNSVSIYLISAGQAGSAFGGWSSPVLVKPFSFSVPLLDLGTLVSLTLQTEDALVLNLWLEATHLGWCLLLTWPLTLEGAFF